jgi:hypothetical protein
MLSLDDRTYYGGRTTGGPVVEVLFDPVAREWVCADEQDRKLRRWPAPELCRERIRNLQVSRRELAAGRGQPGCRIGTAHLRVAFARPN